MMNRFSLLQHLRYRFDNTMSKGIVALIAWLFVLSLVLVLGLALIVLLLGLLPGEPFSEVFWTSMMHALDPARVGDDEGSWIFRLTMFGIALVGLFLVSVLIGVINNGIEGKLDDLRKGRSIVIEEGHTVILGWGPAVFSIVSELVIANANLRRSAIAILAAQDKVFMEDEIRDKVGHTGRTRVICRTGDPLDLTDLEIVNPHAARSIIIPAPDAPDPDTRVIKTILAITNNPNRHAAPYHIAAEIRDSEHLKVAKMVGKDEVELVLADDLISRITVQASLQSGLSVVYIELMDFGGDEIYIHDEPALEGVLFGEALHMYEDSALIGLRYPDGRIAVNPGMDERIPAGTQVIAISEDDDTVRLSEKTDLQIEGSAIRSPDYVTIIPARVLVMGWNRRATLVINQLDEYLQKGSLISVVADAPGGPAAIERDCAGLKHSRVEFTSGDVGSRTLLDSLKIPSYQHIILLSYSDVSETQQADARTLVTLLHLRDIADNHRAGFSIATEMLDVQNRDLAAVTRADDFIVSSKLVSLMLSQISENKDLAQVFETLFSAEGSELYLKPADDYVKAGAEVNFYTVVEAARRKGEVAIGYRVRALANDAGRHYGVRINP
ncbi:MAG TPA: hypothetical protein VMN57_12185, partial [Anaerolineales bacterium]|nr:hypothetical protein [Anaerolineales bacterium]